MFDGKVLARYIVLKAIRKLLSRSSTNRSYQWLAYYGRKHLNLLIPRLMNRSIMIDLFYLRASFSYVMAIARYVFRLMIRHFRRGSRPGLRSNGHTDGDYWSRWFRPWHWNGGGGIWTLTCGAYFWWSLYILSMITTMEELCTRSWFTAGRLKQES